jgi:hypothetical protein
MRFTPERFSEKNTQPKVRRVEGEDKNPFRTQEKKTEDVTTEIEAYRQEAQALLDSHKRFFTTFAKDVSLSFKLGNAFFIDLEKGEVNLATQWFAEKGFSREQILWAVLHELSHFRDLAEDPKRMMAHFETIRDRARQTGDVMMRKWEEKFGDSDPELIESLKRRRPVSRKDPSKTMNAVEKAAYKIHHTFANVFDDIFVNASVSSRAPAYERGSSGGEDVERLYREKLFNGTDYKKLPRHLQFLYSLLRKEMVPGEEVQITEDVDEALAKDIMFQGKSFTARQIVDLFLKPGKKKDTRAGERYFILRKTIEPIFIELLMKDLEEWDPEKPQKPEEGESGEGGEQGQGDPNPFKQEYDEYEKNNPDQIDDEQVENWVEKTEDDKEEAAEREAKAKMDERKSPEERAAEAQGSKDEKWCAENNVSKAALNNFRRIEQEVAPYLDELSALWNHIVYGSGREMSRAIEGHFKTGTELDIQKTVDEWPNIESGKMEGVRVMKREVIKETLVRRPDLIRVRVLADLSGSMDAAKKNVLAQCVVLLLSSLREFNTRLNLTRSQTKSQLSVDTEVWAFGSSAEKIKSFKSDVGGSDERAEMINVLDKLGQSLGTTADNAALSAVSDSLTSEELGRIKDGKTMEIVFEITDGGADNPDASRAAVERLLGDKIIARAFQIGAVGDDEKNRFNAVWNNDREAPLGEAVGENVANLTPAVVSALKKFLSGVRL